MPMFTCEDRIRTDEDEDEENRSRNLSLALGISLLPVFLDLFSSSSSSSVLILSSHVNMGTAAEYYLIFIAVASFASLPLFLSRFRTWEAVSSPNT